MIPSERMVDQNQPFVLADDFSNDGTWEWCEEMMVKDPNFKTIRNEGPKRLGHTILYDELVKIQILRL